MHSNRLKAIKNYKLGELKMKKKSSNNRITDITISIEYDFKSGNTKLGVVGFKSKKRCSTNYYTYEECLRMRKERALKRFQAKIGKL